MDEFSGEAKKLVETMMSNTSSDQLYANNPPPAIHDKWLVDLAEAEGIKTTNAFGVSVGLTHAQIAILIGDRARMKNMGKELAEKERQLAEYKKAIGKLRWWLTSNTSVKGVPDMTDLEVLNAINSLMDITKTMVEACLPIVRSVWTTLATTMRNAGLISE